MPLSQSSGINQMSFGFLMQPDGIFWVTVLCHLMVIVGLFYRACALNVSLCVCFCLFSDTREEVTSSFALRASAVCCTSSCRRYSFLRVALHAPRIWMHPHKSSWVKFYKKYSCFWFFIFFFLHIPSLAHTVGFWCTVGFENTRQQRTQCINPIWRSPDCQCWSYSLLYTELCFSTRWGQTMWFMLTQVWSEMIYSLPAASEL